MCVHQLDPSIAEALGVGEDGVSGSPPPARVNSAHFGLLLDERLAACTIEPPLTLIIARAKLPANVRKSLNARRHRKAKSQPVKAKPAAASDAAATAATDKPVAKAPNSGGSKAAAHRPASALDGTNGSKKKKPSKARKGVSNRFGEYEGSSDSEEEGRYTAADLADDRVLDWIAEEDALAEASTPARIAKAERAKQRAEARVAARNNNSGSASAPPVVNGAGGAPASPLTDFQRQQMDLANFGVDDDSSDSGDGLDGSGAGGGGALEEDEEEEEQSGDASSRANEQERLKLHASMELADRRAYDQMVQHEMNETYGFADSNPRTMILSRDSMLIKLDLMDILNNGVLQFFSESQLEYVFFGCTREEAEILSRGCAFAVG